MSTNPVASPADQTAIEALQALALEEASRARAQAARLAPWGQGEPTEAEVRIVFDRARRALAEQRHQEALRDFTALSAVRPKQSPVFFGMGLSLQMLGHTDAAQQAYAAAYMLDPLRPDVVFRLGECAMALNQPDEARQLWLRALRLSEGAHAEQAGLRELITSALDRLSA